jgi:small subunit ribosomal protein S8
MSAQDPIADMLTCIRNAQMIGKRAVVMPYSRLKHDMLQVLQEEGYINQVETQEVGSKKDLQVTLKYYQGQPVIANIKRISRPALRRYAGYDDLPRVRGGLGIAILSTPKGVMSDRRARAEKIGGEVLCTVE